jgi:hypothetical protein
MKCLLDFFFGIHQLLRTFTGVMSSNDIFIISNQRKIIKYIDQSDTSSQCSIYTSSFGRLVNSCDDLTQMYIAKGKQIRHNKHLILMRRGCMFRRYFLSSATLDLLCSNDVMCLNRNWHKCSPTIIRY